MCNRSILLVDINNGNLLRELTFSKQPELITRIKVHFRISKYFSNLVKFLNSKFKLVGALILASTAKGKIVFWNRKTNGLESIIKSTDNQCPVNSIAYFDNKFYTADK